MTYVKTNIIMPPKSLCYLLMLENPNIKSVLVGRVQNGLEAKGFNPNVLDITGRIRWQRWRLFRLVAYSMVVPFTANKLRIAWVDKRR